MHTHTHKPTHTHAQTCTYTRTYTRAQTYTHSHTNTHTHAHTHIYIYIYIYTRVDWIVCRLPKILSWNVTKWGLFINIVPPCDLHTTFFSDEVLGFHWLKSNQQQLYIYIYIYICRVRKKSTKVSSNQIIRTILTKEGLDQSYILLTKRPRKEE